MYFSRKRMRRSSFELLESRMLLSITGQITGMVQDEYGQPMGGVAVYLEPTDANYRFDDFQVALTGSDGGYSFDQVPPGTYDVELLNSSVHGIGDGYLPPVLLSGVYDDIVIEVGELETQVNFVCELPDPTVDVFFLGDDTGSHQQASGVYFGQIANVVDTLTAIPEINWRFGIGRFEDFNEYPGHPAAGLANSNDVPFELSMGMLSADAPNFDTALQTAISATLPGNGGDTPESLNEALFASTTSAGFLSDSLGPSYTPPIIIAGTDAGTSYQEASPIEDTIYGVENVARTAFIADSYSYGVLRNQTPGQSGATLQDAVDALNIAGARVIGLKSGELIEASGGALPAYALATGTVNLSPGPFTYTYNDVEYSIFPDDPMVIHTMADNLDAVLAAAILNQVQLTPPLATIHVDVENDTLGASTSGVKVGLVPVSLLDFCLSNHIDVPTLGVGMSGDITFHSMVPNEYAIVIEGPAVQTSVYTHARSGDIVIPEQYEADFMQIGANEWWSAVYCHWSPQSDVANTRINTQKVIDVGENDGGPVGIVGFTQPDYGSVTRVGTVFTYTPPTDWEGEATFEYTVQNGASTETATVTIHVGGPKVSSATVGRNTNSHTFTTDSTTYAQLYTVPLSYINKVTLTFEEEGVDFVASDLRVVNATTNHTYWAVSATENSVPEGSSVTWTFGQNFGDGEMYLWLHDSCEFEGVPLDGEWDSPLYFGDNVDNSEFYDGATLVGSGNGLAGGDFEFAFTLLMGDVNRDGTVDGSDITIIACHWQQTGMTWSQGDLNGDGIVDGSDVTLVAYNWQKSYWLQFAMASAAVLPSSSSTFSFSRSLLSEVELIFSEYGLDEEETSRDWLAGGSEKFDRFMDELFDLFG